MKQTHAFWDKRAVKYAASPIADPDAYAHTLGRTRSYLGSSARVLELGCGTGSTALALAPDVARIEGTDYSPQMVRIATEKARDGGFPNARFRVASAAAAVAESEPVDAILALNLLHLTPGHADLFKRIHARLAPGGLFISKTPCLAEPAIGAKRFLFAAMIPAMQVIGQAPFVKRFTMAELEQAIASAGFDLVEVGSFPAMSRYIVARKT